MNSSSWLTACLIALGLFLIVICVSICCLVGAITIFSYQIVDTPYYSNTSTPIAGFPVLTPTPRVSVSTPTPFIVETPVPGTTATPIPPDSDAISETINTLKMEQIPTADLLELSARLEGKLNIPATLESPAVEYNVGDRESFWATNVDSNENFRVEAVLRYETDHLYFWIEDGVDYSSSQLRALAEEFENEIYPTNREFFGSEWSPGVDGDPHLYVLYSSGLGWSVAGYYSSADEYHPDAHEYSNGHEMFMLNSDTIGLGEDFTYGVLAHEFQHMIHWYTDRNETSWMNEGFSELAAFINDYEPGGFDYVFISDPDIQLNDWPGSWGDTTPHYGAGFMFMTYFLDRFGEDATKALIADPQNGFESIDDIFIQLGITDPLTGQTITADGFFQDWVIANYLQDEDAGDGRFNYDNYPFAPQAGDTETIYSCPSQEINTDVHQYGTDYISITCEGDHTITFSGSETARVVPTDFHSGNYAFWSNKGDESDMTLTRQFDFSSVSGEITLSYWTWYDLEEDYDYVYVLSSLDGEVWDILRTPSGTSTDPSGNSYGWGYNGSSNGNASWIQEEVDLSKFAGQQVYIRFEYITDAAVNGEGLVVDDISIPAISYTEDFEAGEGGWQGDGFVRIQNILPQQFTIALILVGSSTTIQYIDVPEGNDLQIPVTIGDGVDEIIVVISGTTRFTRDLAEYQLEVR